jgi:hypothetical protein
MQKKRPNERFFSPLAEQTTSLLAQGNKGSMNISQPRAVLLRAECCWIMLFMLLIIISLVAAGSSSSPLHLTPYTAAPLLTSSPLHPTPYTAAPLLTSCRTDLFVVSSRKQREYEYIPAASCVVASGMLLDYVVYVVDFNNPSRSRVLIRAECCLHCRQ